MYSAQEKVYGELNQIITERQNYEKNNPIPPYSTHPTSLNYKDIKGYGLIHYAALMGDVEKIKFCIDQKADVNLDFSDFNLPLAQSHKSPLQMALENGHLETAKLLYEAGANVESIRLHMCATPACRDWFKSLMTEAFSTAYPEATKIESDPTEENRFFKKLNPYRKTDSIRYVLIRAIEIGDIDFLKKIFENNESQANSNSSQFFKPTESVIPDILKADNKGIFYPETASLIQIAVANKNQSIVEYLLSKNHKINPEKPYRTHPLVFAILNDDEKIFDFLLEKNADIHYPDRKKYTPLMHAVLNNHVHLVKKLLEKGARIDDLSIDGDNVFHLLALKNNHEMLEILSQAKGADKIKNKKNIYGFTPEDIRTKLANNTLPPTINQTKIAHIMHYYLVSQYRDTKFFHGGPHCNGFTFKYLLTAAFENPEYYFATMTLFSTWDGSTSLDNFLFKNFEDNFEIDGNLRKIYQKYHYKNLAEVLEQWISDVAWFQANSHIPGTNGMQQDRDTQYAQHADFKKQSFIDNQPKFLLFEHNSDCESYKSLDYSRSYEQHVEIFKYFMRMPEGLSIEFQGSGHTTGAFLHASRGLQHADPNHKYQTLPVSTPEEIAQDIINYKYIRLKNAPDNMVCSIQFFYTHKDVETMDFNASVILTEDEIPKDKTSVELFQKNSPNKFTPLHIAIMTNNMKLLKILLVNHDFYDLNSRDSYNRTPLHLAQMCHSEEAIVELLKYENLLDTKNLSHVMSQAYKKKQFNISMHIFEKKLELDYSYLIELAITNNDVELVKKIIEQKTVDIHLKQTDAPFPLTIAIQSIALETVKYLLERGADLFIIDSDSALNTTSGIEEALMDYKYNKKIFKLICQHLKSTQQINNTDQNGFAAIHYAVKYNNPEALRLLLDNGADIDLLDKNNQSILDYCTEIESSEIKQIINEHKEFIGLQSGLRF